MRDYDDQYMVEGKRYSFKNKQNNIVMIATLVSKDGGGALTIRREDPVVTLNLRVDVFEAYDVTDIGDAGRLRWDTGLISSPSGPTEYSIDTADARRQTLSRTSPTIFGYSTRHTDASPAASQAEMDASRTEGRNEMKAMGAANWRNENAYTTDDTRGNTSFNGVKRAQSSNIVDWNAVGNNVGFGLTRAETNRGWGGSKKLSRKSSKSKKSRKSKKSKKSRKSKKMRK